MLDNLRAWVAAKMAPPGMSLAVVPLGQGAPPKRGTPELLRAYSEMPWLRAVVNKVGRTVGATTWTLWVQRGRTGRAIRNRSLQHALGPARSRAIEDLRKQVRLSEIEDHALLDLLAHGNDHLPGSLVMQLVQQHLDLVGEGFLVKVRGALRQPTDLWPIPPSWIWETPFLDAAGEDIYRIQYRSWRAEVGREDMVWMVDPDVANPYGRGSGTARALTDELDADEFAAKHIAAFFRNSARPDLLVSMKNGDAAAARALEAKWLEKFQGPFNRRKPLITSAEIAATEIGQSFQEIQLVPLREFERNTIVQTYGFPPELLGILQNSNRATIESAEFFFMKHVIVPRLEMLRTYMQEYLVPEFDDRLILDYVSPVEEDKEHKARVYQATPYAFTIDEHRELAGLEDLPGGKGKLHPRPLTLEFVAELDEETEPPAPPPGAPGLNPFGGSDDADGEADGEGEDGTADDSEEMPSADDGDASAKALPRVVVPLAERRLIRRPGRHAPASRALTDGGLETFLRTLDDGTARRSVWGVAAVHAGEIVARFGQRMLDQIGAAIEFQATARVVEFVKRWGIDRSRLIDTTTKDALRDVLSTAIDRGDTSREMVKAIQGVYSDATRSRAFLIARTEGTRAANFGANESFKQAGIEQKSWLATMDNHVRDAHAELDGQVVDALASFVVPAGTYAGATADYPGEFGIAALDINCRCATTAVFLDDDGRAYDPLDTTEKRVKAWKAFEAERISAERGFRKLIRRRFRVQERIVIKRFHELAGE